MSITLFYKMPKLKKHSQIQTKRFSDSNFPKSIDSEETQGQDSAFRNNIIKPTRMKYQQRIKQFEYIPPTNQNQHNQSNYLQKNSNKRLQSNDQMELFLNKFTDNQDDDISVVQENTRPPKVKNTKPCKPLLKTSNKMFSDINFEQSLQEQCQDQQQRLEIEIEKKEKKQNVVTMQKLQKKADFYKKKLEYKDLAKDQRYKRNIQEKLKSIQDVEQVDILVEIPKVFGGKQSEVQAALFLKNQEYCLKQKDLSDHISSQLDQDETSIPKDRKIYYSELEKHVKLKKAEKFSASTLRQCFKKSILGDEDYICIFEDRQGNYQEFIESQNTKPQITNKNSKQEQESRNSIRKPAVKDFESSNNKEFEWGVSKEQVQHKKPQQNKNQNIMQTSMNHIGKHIKNEGYKQYLSNSVDQSLPEGKKKSKNNRKNRNKLAPSFKALIEVQAQISDDEQNGGAKNQEGSQSEEEDASNISSLIADEESNTQDAYKLRKKFIQDVVQQQQRHYEQIRKKIEKRYLQEEQRLKKRMEEAAKKNHEKEKQQEIIKKQTQVIQQSNTRTSHESSTCTLEKEKNKEKLKELESMLGREVKPQRDPIQSEGGRKVGKLEELQVGILNSKKPEYKKPGRNGFKNIQAHKQTFKIYRPKP